MVNSLFGGAVDIWIWMLDHLLYVNLIFSVLIVFFQRKDPKAVWTWLMVLYFIPIIGFILYLIICQDMHKSRMFRVKEIEDHLNFSIKSQEEFIRNHDMELDGRLARDYTDLVLYNLETSGAVFTRNNNIKIFTDGEDKFSHLIEDMKRAEQFIHIQYYIIKNDELFARIQPVLIEKAREGVEIRILYDGMGGRFMPKKIWNLLRSEGIKTGEFFPPILRRLHLRMNYRNHRKIVVIDGKIGYVGGFNIGKEYISKDPKFGYWRDTHLRIEGAATISLQIRFALDWNYTTKENLFRDRDFFEPEIETSSKKGVQIITSGPDTKYRQIRDNYLQLFHKAKEYIYIQTPYFVPDDAILSALTIAAKSGVDVRLMIPCKPDHPFVYWATYSYVGDLLEAGAKCYTYENGFLHAKGVIVDGEVSCYGTANMDIRSFELNFEVNAIIFDEETAKQLETIFLKDIEHSREVTLEIYTNRSFWVVIKEQCSRLLSPLL